ncbi:MAG: sugar transferase [Clostridia bacterium]|nr:sugar transferase [Clostridia bacterium]
MRQLQLVCKHVFDFVVCLIVLILISPLFLILCIAIRVSDHGPAFFKQKRIGKNGKVFEIYKFRTMVVNAEKIGDGLVVQTEDDPRITRVGRLLRKTSLDEVPQLLNIIKGEMSIIGPRPPVTYHPYDGYENYPEWAKKRFEMRPGITGLAQVEKRNSASWDERMEIDVRYVEKFSLALDAKIFFRTFVSMKYTEEYTDQEKKD